MILITIVERSDSTLDRKMVMYVYYIFIIVTLQKLLRERPFRDCCTPGLMMMIFFDDDNDEKNDDDGNDLSFTPSPHTFPPSHIYNIIFSELLIHIYIYIIVFMPYNPVSQ